MRCWQTIVCAVAFVLAACSGNVKSGQKDASQADVSASRDGPGAKDSASADLSLDAALDMSSRDGFRDQLVDAFAWADGFSGPGTTLNPIEVVAAPGANPYLKAVGASVWLFFNKGDTGSSELWLARYGGSGTPLGSQKVFDDGHVTDVEPVSTNEVLMVVAHWIDPIKDTALSRIYRGGYTGFRTELTVSASDNPQGCLNPPLQNNPGGRLFGPAPVKHAVFGYYKWSWMGCGGVRTAFYTAAGPSSWQRDDGVKLVFPDDAARVESRLLLAAGSLLVSDDAGASWILPGIAAQAIAVDGKNVLVAGTRWRSTAAVDISLSTDGAKSFATKSFAIRDDGDSRVALRGQHAAVAFRVTDSCTASSISSI
jgi:hypothetical protein